MRAICIRTRSSLGSLSIQIAALITLYSVVGDGFMQRIPCAPSLLLRVLYPIHTFLRRKLALRRSDERTARSTVLCTVCTVALYYSKALRAEKSRQA